MSTIQNPGSALGEAIGAVSGKAEFLSLGIMA
jgi:hypothetical protein